MSAANRTPPKAKGLALYRSDASMVGIAGSLLLVAGVALGSFGKGFRDWRFGVCGERRYRGGSAVADQTAAQAF